MWRLLRIVMLLTVLALVAGITWVDRQRTTDWDRPLRVGVFPINGDGRAATDRYIATLNSEQFEPIARFFSREAQRFGLAIAEPFRMQLEPKVLDLPPRLERDRGLLSTVWWSLRIRYYAWRAAGRSTATIRMFVLYHDPSRTRVVPHSLGLQKGLLGIVYAFAEPQMAGANNIVIAHELLHTVGATDKYDPRSNLPLFPQGYGEPAAEPRYPQESAELMAGRLAVSAQEAVMPVDLDEVVIGSATAAEIRWPAAEPAR